MRDLPDAHQRLAAHPLRFEYTPQQSTYQIAVLEIDLIVVADLPYSLSDLQVLNQAEVLQPCANSRSHLNRHNCVIIIQFDIKSRRVLYECDYSKSLLIGGV